jgi:hypothetical protein
MSESDSAPYSEPAIDPPERDPLSLRRSIHDLGSRDHDVRMAARARILSAGELAQTSLLRELERDRRKIKAGAQRVALVVAGILITGPVLSSLFQAPWLLTLANLSAVVVLLIACMLATRSTWHREAAKLLSRYQCPDTTRAMIDTLTDVWGEDQPMLREAIIQRLGRVRPSDASWLKGETRERVIALLSMPDWASPNCVEDFVTIGRALATVGATEAIPVLKGANCSSLGGEKRERLRRALDEVVLELEAKERAGKHGDRHPHHGTAVTHRQDDSRTDNGASGSEQNRTPKVGHGP